MQRRIPDFPDSFHSWNFLSSIGSGITFLSFAIFFLVFFFFLHFLFVIIISIFLVFFFEFLEFIIFLEVNSVSQKIIILKRKGIGNLLNIESRMKRFLTSIKLFLLFVNQRNVNKKKEKEYRKEKIIRKRLVHWWDFSLNFWESTTYLWELTSMWSQEYSKLNWDSIVISC